ncbi:hypothetical protein SNEBB_005391 [Seison nebaliae]|nr:hypothetical protein SNEBB_005391 [Seison nebaliae]
MPQYSLHYFNARGPAEFIRYMFAYAKVPYEDKRYEPQEWPKVKPTMPFGTVPVLFIDSKRTLGQSRAIGRFLAHEFGLLPKNAFESAKCDEFVDQMSDAHSDVAQLYHNREDKEKAKKIFEELVTTKLDAKLMKLEKMIEENGGEYCVGKQLTWADFHLSTMLALWHVFELGDYLKKYVNMAKIQKKVENLPEVKKWIAKRPVTIH